MLQKSNSLQIPESNSLGENMTCKFLEYFTFYIQKQKAQKTKPNQNKETKGKKERNYVTIKGAFFCGLGRRDIS